ncbi:MAG: hydroxysqualene dehydroxylase HpnE [Alphaproteobacteria bacterium]
MSAPTVHVIGAGVSGLAAAVRLAGAGQKFHVVVYDSASHGGGRCRSYLDATLDRRIDNGNHLLLSGNDQVMAFLTATGAADTLDGPERAEFPFLDLGTGEKWSVRPGKRRLPLWLLCKHMRVPSSSVWDYLSALKMAWAGSRATVADCLNTTRPLYRKFWQPLTAAVLNTEPEEGAASLLWPVLKSTFGRGAAACRPLMAKDGLSETFVGPAIEYIGRHGGEVHLNRRLRFIDFQDNRASALDFSDASIDLGIDDFVILALPYEAAGGLLAGLQTPMQSRAIVNGHFRLESVPDGVTFLGLVGGVAQWLFVRGDVVSVTVSAADELAGRAAEDIAIELWADIVRALDLGESPLPPYRIVKEKRATFAATPEQAARRPGTRTKWSNLMLAGDWTATGLPATIEGAVTSGHRAAAAVFDLSKGIGG